MRNEKTDLAGRQTTTGTRGTHMLHNLLAYIHDEGLTEKIKANERETKTDAVGLSLCTSQL